MDNQMITTFPLEHDCNFLYLSVFIVLEAFFTERTARKEGRGGEIHNNNIRFKTATMYIDTEFILAAV